jgi:KDO2-lipid IV(A) lauroyltransferase
MKIKTRRYYIYYMARIGFFLINFLPLTITLRLSRILGKAAFKYLPKYADIAVENLKRRCGMTDGGARDVAEKLFVNLTRNGAELAKLAVWDNALVGSLVTGGEGFEKLDEALSKGKGALVITGHFGNWDLLMSYVRSRGYSGAVIGRKIYFHKYDDFITRLRKKTGDRVIYRDESPKKILRVLKDGEIIGILADQDIEALDGVFVKFFGEDAFTPVAPVKLAMVSGAPLVPAFIIRGEDLKHRVVICDPIYVPKEDNSPEAVLRYTQAWTDVLERFVRQYPDQWVWIHKRWKTKKG